jgi:hypothetical protein
MPNELQRVEAAPVAAPRTTAELAAQAAAAVLGGLMAGEKTVATFVGYTFVGDMMVPSYVPDPASEAPAAPAQG